MPVRRHALAVLCLSTLAACATQPPDLSGQIQYAVRQTLAAMPSPTAHPATRAPGSPTPAKLAGLFCEYEFCIGHPKELAFYDVVAKQNPNSPAGSQYDDGILAASSTSAFIEVIWQNAPAGGTPEFLLNQILTPGVDTRSGDNDSIASAEITALYVGIRNSATAMLPYGGASAWLCGSRAFAWKAYTAQPEIAKNLAIEALRSFRCEK